MMAQERAPTVRASVIVDATIERAFHRVHRSIGTWFPPEYNLLVGGEGGWPGALHKFVERTLVISLRSRCWDTPAQPTAGGPRAIRCRCRPHPQPRKSFARPRTMTHAA
jgi:hypothetical protein